MVIPLYLGKDRQNNDKPTYPVFNPLSRKIVHHVESANKEDLQTAVDVAQAALPSWSATPLHERAAVIRRAASLLRDESSGWKENMRVANIEETSAPTWWAGFQTEDVIGFLEALADSVSEALAPWTVTGSATTTYITREPYGVCLAMAAWNAVPMLTSRAIITPLIAGNTVVMKTSEISPHSQALWADLLYEAGLPRGALTVVHIDPQEAPALTPLLIQDKRIRHVNFTGSTRVGSILAGIAGQALKPSVMELGGKAPVLLLPDADFSTAASHIIFGTMMNAGQICMSTERIFVPASHYDELRSALQNAWSTLEQRQARALFTDASANRISDLVDDAIALGIEPILDDVVQVRTADSALVRPQIYGPATPAMKLYQEETFGPISVVVKVDDAGRTEEELVREMIDLANESDYGLSASVWSQDETKARNAASRLESGAVHINSPTPHDLPNVPHGGWKSSGWGRFNGVEGIRNFAQTKSVEVPNKPSNPLPLNVFGL